MNVLIHGRPASERDVREFLGYKKRRGEPVRVDIDMAAQASAVISDRIQFASIRQSLRAILQFGRASERLDALEHELRLRRGIALPLPDRLMQNADGTLGLVWPGITVAANVDALVWLIGGPTGSQGEGLAPALVDSLAHLAK